MAQFSGGEAVWIAKLGNLRNTIRQEVIARQLHQHLGHRRSVLDVGCGQGTQALRLLQRGCSVVGVEPSLALIELFSNDARKLELSPDIRHGGIDDLDAVLGSSRFDAVCAHGLLMYLDSPAAGVAILAERVAEGGLLSLTVKNAHGLAMRPALRGDWPGALAAFDDHGYVNELGVAARSDRIEDVEAWLGAVGFSVRQWYGVRVFNDAVPGDVVPPPAEELSVLLDAEERAGESDPYRWLGSQLHVLAARD